MYFTGVAFYIVVRCGFEKHLYLTSCLNAHNHNTCIPLPQTCCTARKMALFIIGPVIILSGSGYMARIRATEANWGRDTRIICPI